MNGSLCNLCASALWPALHIFATRCDPTLWVLVLLLSRNVFHVVSPCSPSFVFANYMQSRIRKPQVSDPLTKACVIKKECFVDRRRLMALSCGKKTNLPSSFSNAHDDLQISGQKRKFPICSSACSLWCSHNWLSENKLPCCV